MWNRYSESKREEVRGKKSLEKERFDHVCRRKRINGRGAIEDGRGSVSLIGRNWEKSR